VTGSKGERPPQGAFASSAGRSNDRVRGSLKYPTLLAAIASLFSLASSVAFAQAVPAAQPGADKTLSSAEEKPRSGDGKSPDDWRFAATAYGWAINLNGSASIRGNTVDINASVFDLLQKSSSLMGLMGDFEANKGKFGFSADVVWAQLGVPKSAGSYRNPIPGVTLSAQANAFDTFSMTIIEAAGLYEVGKWPGSDQSFTALDLYAGGRFWNASNQINLDLTGAIAFSDPRLAQFDRSKTIGVADSGSRFWADPLIGLRLRHQFTPSQHAFIKGDVGGFGLSGSSLFSWQVAAVYSYTWQFNGYALAADIGYRALSTNVNFTNDGPFTNNFDLVIHGPLIGLTVKF
jgi:hypothetical protein